MPAKLTKLAVLGNKGKRRDLGMSEQVMKVGWSFHIPQWSGYTWHEAHEELLENNAVLETMGNLEIDETDEVEWFCSDSHGFYRSREGEWWVTIALWKGPAYDLDEASITLEAMQRECSNLSLLWKVEANDIKFAVLHWYSGGDEPDPDEDGVLSEIL